MEKRRIKIGVLFLLVLVVIAIDFSILYAISNTSESLSTEKADALYGGEADDKSYPFSGYLVDYSSLFTSQLCGVTYLAPQIGVSAAHCFDNDGLYFGGTGDFKTSPEQNSAVHKFVLDKNWDSQSLTGDIAVISFEEPVKGLTDYAKIATPEKGCNYEILAYGSTDEKILSSKDLRRRADICIESVSQDRFYFTSESGGICFGDSGSPIFIKDTNKIVGLVSAITADNAKYSEDNCFVNNRAVATRLDNSLSFIASSEEPLQKAQTCPTESNHYCTPDETCRSNLCRGLDDYIYSSALDYRSVDYILGGFSSTAAAAIFIGGTVLFLGFVYRSFRKAY